MTTTERISWLQAKKDITPATIDEYIYWNGLNDVLGAVIIDQNTGKTDTVTVFTLLYTVLAGKSIIGNKVILQNADAEQFAAVECVYAHKGCSAWLGWDPAAQNITPTYAVLETDKHFRALVTK